jgi:hypothetical protein
MTQIDLARHSEQLRPQVPAIAESAANNFRILDIDAPIGYSDSVQPPQSSHVPSEALRQYLSTLSLDEREETLRAVLVVRSSFAAGAGVSIGAVSGVAVESRSIQP